MRQHRGEKQISGLSATQFLQASSVSTKFLLFTNVSYFGTSGVATDFLLTGDGFQTSNDGWRGVMRREAKFGLIWRL